MNAINGILDSISATFKGSTCTGLDLLEKTPVAPDVAESLFYNDHVPATADEIIAAYTAVHGSAPAAGDVIEVEQFLSEFGWLQ